jgi:uncharacterized protein (DUF488 family)
MARGSGHESRIFTVGHSTRSLEELVELLRAHGVKALADVRAFPGSRRYPHFNAENLAAELPGHGLAYLPFPALGGRRKGAADSINTGWRNASFRAYADYMQTPAFSAALDELIHVARASPTAIMCSEAVPWRCHRSLIADALLVRGWRVLDIMTPARAQEHKLAPFAKVEGLQITYPGAEPELF